MDVRLTAEQRQLRDAAAKLADDLGPGAVQDLDDQNRIARLDKQIDVTGWRSLRSDGASGVEVAIVAEEFGRRVVDAPFLGPVLADDLARHVDADAAGATAGRGRPGDRRPRRSARPGAVRRHDPVDGPGRRSDGRRSDPVGSGHAGIAGRARRRQPRGCRTVAGAGAGDHRRPTWSASPAVHRPSPATTRKSASSTATRSGPIKPSRTCWPKALR